MKSALTLLLIVVPLCGRMADAAEPLDPDILMCATNPAYSLPVMKEILNEQLQKDHDPSLDEAPPDQLAQEAVNQGITECAQELHKDPSVYAALSPFSGAERLIGWDAYNTACRTHSGLKGACISAEVGAVRALKHMAATDTPPGARILVQACQLVLKTDPAMADWRQCVDQSLAVHASGDKAAACKLSVNWHVARTGAEAGAVMTKCLAGR